MDHLDHGEQNMKRKNKFYVLCIDPGKLTGMALFCFENGIVTLIWTREVKETETGFVIEETVQKYGPDIEIVDEKFFITEKTFKIPDAPWSLEFNGVAKHMARKYNIKYYWQSASDAKTFCPDERLHNLSLWHKGGEGHANDALRHGVLHLVRCYRWVPDGLLVDDEEDEG